MILDIDALVAPLSDDQPSGKDYYGDIKRQQIELAFERSISEGSASELSLAEWQNTIDLIMDQCGSTRDLWLPVYLMRAAVQAGQFDLLVDAAQFLAALIETRWADVHPQLEDLGFLGRKTPCEALTRIGDFLGPLESVPLVVHSRLGGFSGGDFNKFNEHGAKAAGYVDFRQAMTVMGEEPLRQAVAQLETLTAAIRSVDRVLSDNADGDTATNFQPTYDVIDKMKKSVTAFLPDAVPEASDAPEPVETGDDPVLAQPVRASSAAAFTGSINNRADVVRAIDSICAYYERCEPGSPVPFALRRAKHWINLDFMAVLEDIAPGGAEEAMRVLKVQSVTEPAVTNWDDDTSGEVEWAGASDDSSGGNDGWG